MYGPFHNADFRKLFVGRVITNIGDSLYFIGAMWLVYSLTGDAFFTGLAGFLTLLPSGVQFLFGPLVDRWPIRSTLVCSQLSQAIIVSILPIAHYFDVLTVGIVLVIMPTLSLLNQFVYPAQSAALPRILDDQELVAANSAFSIAYQGIEMVANGISGILIGIVGVITVFIIDATTFVLAALIFATVTIPPAATSGDRSLSEDEKTDGSTEAVKTDGSGIDAEDDSSSYIDELRAGMSFLRGTFLVGLLGGVLVLNFLAGFALASLPVYADSIRVPSELDLLAGAGAYGILMAAFATGHFLGMIGANAVTDRPLGWTMVTGFAFSGTVAVAAIAIHWLPLTALLLCLTFLPFGVINVQVSALVQSAPPEEVVGRVSSLVGSASSVSVPFGALLGGIAGSALGPRVTMFGIGLGGFLLTIYVLASPTLRTLPKVEMIDLEVR